jgi:SsrA-binding protein
MLIPLNVFLKNNFVKILLGLARPRKKQDKRELIKKREFKREVKKYE